MQFSGQTKWANFKSCGCFAVLVDAPKNICEEKTRLAVGVDFFVFQVCSEKVCHPARTT